MNVFEFVKQNVTARQVADYYGIAVNRHGMACCPFHNDKHPSMKVDVRYYCFGCGEKGDAINFVEKYFGLSPKDAALKICQDFGLDYKLDRPDRANKASKNNRTKNARAKPKKSPEQLFVESCEHCYRVLCDYLHLLRQWKAEYAPRADTEDWHPLFVEACQEIEHINYLLDILWDGTIEEQAAFLKDNGKKVKELEERINEINKGTGSDCQAGSQAA